MLFNETLNALQHTVALRAKFCLPLADRIEFAARTAVRAKDDRPVFGGEGRARFRKPLPVRAIPGTRHVARRPGAFWIVTLRNSAGERVLKRAQEARTLVVLVDLEQNFEHRTMLASAI